MKYLRYFLIVGTAFLSLSFTTSKVIKPSEGIYPGDLFPDIKNIESISGTTVHFSELKGQKMLVNLWASYNAQSRKENAVLSNMISIEKSITLVSLSFDKSKSVFEKTVTIDKIDNNMQFWINDDSRSNLNKLYKLDKRLQNCLIDENGQILAINLDASEVEQHLERN